MEENGLFHQSENSKTPVDRKKPRRSIRDFIVSEKLKNYAGAISILLGALPGVGSLIVSISTSMRGEPTAQRAVARIDAAYEILRPEIDKQRVTLQILTAKIATFEGRFSGYDAASIQLKLDEANNRIKELEKILEEKRGSEPPIVPNPVAVQEKCPKGKVWLDTSCVTVSKAVASQVAKAQEVLKNSESMEAKLVEAKKEKEALKSLLKEKNQKREQMPSLEKLPNKIDDSEGYDVEAK